MLEAQGLKCWIAPRDISPSADWAAEIIDAISSARVMLLVFSASSNQSPQVRREVERAVHKGVTVLPFRIEDVVPSKSLEFFLSAQHWMDAFPPPREPHYRRLSSYLNAQLAAAPDAPLSGARGGPPPPASDAAGPGALSPRELAHIEAAAGFLHWSAGEVPGQAGSPARGRDRGTDRKLSNELEAESDRNTFVQRCRHLRAPIDPHSAPLAGMRVSRALQLRLPVEAPVRLRRHLAGSRAELCGVHTSSDPPLAARSRWS